MPLSSVFPLVKNEDDDKEMAMPLEKKRDLPKWMVGSSKRVDVSPTSEKSPNKNVGEFYFQHPRNPECFSFVCVFRWEVTGLSS